MNTAQKLQTINDFDLSKVVRIKRQSSEIEKEFENGLNIIEPIFKKIFPEIAELFNRNSIVETFRNSEIVNARKAIAYYLNLHNFAIEIIARILGRPKETIYYTIRYFEEEIVVNRFICECNKAFVEYYYSQTAFEVLQMKDLKASPIKVVKDENKPRKKTYDIKIVPKNQQYSYKPDEKRIEDSEVENLKQNFKTQFRHRPIRDVFNEGLNLISELYENYYGKEATADMVIKKNRTDEIVLLRMAMIRFLTLHGFGKSEIARFIERDHSTIIHACTTYESQKDIFAFFIDCEILYQSYYHIMEERFEYEGKIDNTIVIEFINSIKNFEFKFKEEKTMSFKLVYESECTVKYEEYILSNIKLKASNMAKICKLMIDQFRSYKNLMTNSVKNQFIFISPGFEKLNPLFEYIINNWEKIFHQIFKNILQSDMNLACDILNKIPFSERKQELVKILENRENISEHLLANPT